MWVPKETGVGRLKKPHGNPGLLEDGDKSGLGCPLPPRCPPHLRDAAESLFNENAGGEPVIPWRLLGFALYSGCSSG